MKYAASAFVSLDIVFSLFPNNHAHKPVLWLFEEHRELIYTVYDRSARVSSAAVVTGEMLWMLKTTVPKTHRAIILKGKYICGWNH